VFGRLVREYMDIRPTTVTVDTPCGEAVSILREGGSSSLIVTGDEGRILGILTERDVAHRVAYLANRDSLVGSVMTSPIVTIREDDYIFRAIAVMRRNGLRHLPVLDSEGRLAGMLHLHAALAASMPGLLDLIDRLTHEDTLDGLKQVKRAQVELVMAMLEDQVPAPGIQTLLTTVNNDIYRRVVERHLTEMFEQGWGKAPVPFDVIVMGSGGREENFLSSDQDNGFILADYPNERHFAVDTFFIELAERATDSLDAIGIPLCKGYVMATNPLWRKRISDWKQQLGLWLRRPNTATLRFGDIFFDFRCVYGDGELAGTLRQHLTGEIRQRHPFLLEMQRVQKGHGVALGAFKRLSTDSTDGPGRGKINLKYHGLLPLVEAIRLLALREGIAETSTLVRIDSLHRNGVLDDNEQDYLSGAFHHITMLVLRQQIRDFAEQKPIVPHVAPETLSKREKDILVDSLNAINDLRKRVELEFTASIF
jgi:signal-transduction protein with cAMP-binding, CBS, and nucleotidyltransferase domain